MISLLRRWRSPLALRWLWLRHAYTFNWAHQPLCGRFRAEVIRIGRVYVCRSCAAAYAGLLAAALTCALFRHALAPVCAPLFLVVGALTVVLSAPFWYKRWPRPMRDVLRFAMGGTIALCGCLLLSGEILLGLSGAAVLAVFWKAYWTLRRPRRLKACAGCAELREDSICSGYARQAERVRQYEIAATELVILKGLNSGESTPMTREDWETIRQEVRTRYAERKRG